MDENIQASDDVPQWLRWTVSACFFGNPDPESAALQRTLWNQHYAEMHADPSVSQVSLLIDATGSSLTHVLWRLTYGPPTPATPGVLIILFSAIALLLAATPAYSLTSSSAGSGALGLVGGSLLFAEARGEDRSWLTRVLWAIVAGGLLFTAFDYLINPVLPISDRVAAPGTAVICAALLPNTLRSRTRTSWRRWTALSVGLLVLGLSNLIAGSELLDDGAANISFILFTIETASALALLRWSFDRRSIGKETPNRAVILTNS